MTRTRRRIVRPLLLAATAASSILFAGHHSADLVQLAAAHSCELGTMMINPCADLDTSNVTDLRGAPISFDLDAIVEIGDADVDADVWRCLQSGPHTDELEGHAVSTTRLALGSCDPFGWVGGDV